MIIDSHAHIMADPSDRGGIDHILELAARFDIQRMVVSMGRDLQEQPTESQVREANDHVISLMRGWPGRIFGYCYLNPRLGRSSLDELQRCLDAGMIGIKLWVSCRCNDRQVFPIVERAIDLNVAILQHTWLKTVERGDNESQPDDLVSLARRYPQGKFIMAHAGGNWEYGLKAARACPNVVVDISGANPTQGYVEMAIRELGPRRILFGTDATLRSFASQIAKIDAVKMPRQIRERIVRKNAEELLRITV